MRKVLICLLTCMMLVMVSVMPMDVKASDVSLKKRLDASANAGLAKAYYGVSVRDMVSNRIIYERNGNTGIKPASNMKLLTAATALKKLGEEFRFQTELYIDGVLDAGVLNGNVYLKGQGDPTLMQSDLVNFADALKNAGIKTITGQLIGDVTWFDNEFRMRGVVPEDEWQSFAPQISALTLSPSKNFDVGTIIVNVSPGSMGKSALASVTPRTNHVRIVNNTKTVSKGYKNTVSIYRQYGTNTIIVSGNLPVGKAKQELVTVDNPALYTLDVFALAIQSKGITVNNKVQLGQVPENATKMTQKFSAPLKTLVQINLRQSNNGMSETFSKAIGRVVRNEGTWDAGIAVMKDYATSLGLEADKWQIADTSGLSHNNRITANEQTKLLWAIRQESYYNSFLGGLPVAANADKSLSTTLYNRLTGNLTRNRVHAKTGYITGVNSLSGYVKAKSGNWYIFSILTQNTKYASTKTIDEMVTIIAEEM